MVIRRRNPASRRPALASAGFGQALPVADADAAGSVEAGGADPGLEAMRQRAAADFAERIRRSGDLGQDDIDSLMQAYTEAVGSAELAPVLTPPDRGQWQEMVELMVQAGMMDAGDAPALVRSFDEVFGEVGSGEFDTLVEFSRRCREDGQEQAVEWLHNRRQAEEDSRLATGQDLPASLGPSLTQRGHRIRRARGPPTV